MPHPTVSRLQIDCREPVRLSQFWCELLGYEERGRIGDPPQYLAIAGHQPNSLRLCFQRVPEAKVGKNRLHLDLAVEDLDAATAEVINLGGTRPRRSDLHEFGMRWRILCDPEGNEFCIEHEDGFERR